MTAIAKLTVRQEDGVLHMAAQKEDRGPIEILVISSTEEFRVGFVDLFDFLADAALEFQRKSREFQLTPSDQRRVNQLLK